VAEEEAKEGYRNKLSTEDEAQQLFLRLRRIEDEKVERARLKELAEYEYKL
jgi:hypothetical protein